MENFERLSNKVLIRTCPCGVVFKTYDPKKMYHSNKCRASYVRERYGAMTVQRRELKAKEIEDKVMGKVLAVNLDRSLRNNTSLNEFMSKGKSEQLKPQYEKTEDKGYGCNA